MASETGVNLIKKKVATLKTELDESQNRANEAEEQLTHQQEIIEKVSFDRDSYSITKFLFGTSLHLVLGPFGVLQSGEF